MTVPLLDLTREHRAIADEVRGAWEDALGAMRLLRGRNVQLFEHEIAAYLAAPAACGVGSGTDALLLTLLALEVGPGDEVIVQANAFIAALEAIRLAGAQPVVVDIEADGLGPDPEDVAAAITPRTKAILVVHLYGAPLPLSTLQPLAEVHGLHLVEDGSHAHGAARAGRKVGTFGDAGCFSTGVVKNLGAYGDAGFVVASSSLIESIRVLQAHGQQQKNHHVVYGLNSRLDEIQAAVLRVKLRHLDARNQRRRAIAAYYSSRLAGLDIRLPREQVEEVHVYHQYVLRVGQRDQLKQHLHHAGIETGIHYPVPLHRQPAWLRAYGECRSLPRAEQLAHEVLSLPVFPDLTDVEVERVADAVVSFFSNR